MELKAPKYTQSEELSKELTEAHKMLKKIGVPVPPLKRVKIGYDKNYKTRSVGRCGYITANLEEGQKPYYLILLHPWHKQSQATQQEGDAFDLSRRCSILHELVHTCKNTQTPQEHNQRFLEYGKLIKEKTLVSFLSYANIISLNYLDLIKILVFP